MMNWRTTAVFLGIVLLLGGYIFWQRQQDKPTVTETADLTPLPPTPERVDLIGGTLADIRGLGITRLDDESEVLFLQEPVGVWASTVPTTTQVLSSTINTPLSSFLLLRSIRTLAADLNELSAYGLDSPTYRISVAIDKSDVGTTVPVILLVGAPTPVGNGYYVQVEGDDRVHIAPLGIIDGMVDLLENPPEAAPAMATEPPPEVAP